MSQPEEHNPQIIADQLVISSAISSQHTYRRMVGACLLAGAFVGALNPNINTTDLIDRTVMVGAAIAAVANRVGMQKQLSKTVNGFAESSGVVGQAKTGMLRPQIPGDEAGVSMTPSILEQDPDIPSKKTVSDVIHGVVSTQFAYGAAVIGGTLASGNDKFYEQSPAYFAGWAICFGGIALNSWVTTERNAIIAEENALDRIENISSIASLNPIPRPIE